jgi:hypothetical protein
MTITYRNISDLFSNRIQNMRIGNNASSSEPFP